MAQQLYIANENGDWWMIEPDSVLYVLKPEDVPADASDADDKFEQVIMEHGTTIEEFFNDVVSVLNS